MQCDTNYIDATINMFCSSDWHRKTFYSLRRNELISHNSLHFNESSLFFVERLFYCSQTFLDMFRFEELAMPHKSSLLIKLSTTQELSTVLEKNLTQLNLNSLYIVWCTNTHSQTLLHKLKIRMTS